MPLTIKYILSVTYNRSYSVENPKLRDAFPNPSQKVLSDFPYLHITASVHKPLHLKT